MESVHPTCTVPEEDTEENKSIGGMKNCFPVRQWPEPRQQKNTNMTECNMLCEARKWRRQQFDPNINTDESQTNTADIHTQTHKDTRLHTHTQANK